MKVEYYRKKKKEWKEAGSKSKKKSRSGSTMSSSVSMSALDKPSVGVSNTGLVEDYIGRICSGKNVKGSLLKTVMGTDIGALRERSKREVKLERGKIEIANILEKSLR